MSTRLKCKAAEPRTEDEGRALVTGAAGFIGSHLTERLLALGYRVTGVDSFDEHYSKRLKRLNLAKAAGDARFELVEADIGRDEIDHLLGEVDIVFHLAARPGVRDSWKDFCGYVDANVVGTEAIFAAAAAAEKRVVYASSSSVYGEAADQPIAETHPLEPISPYAATKVMTEALAGVYSSSCGLDAVGLRYFSVYGPRQRPDMALARFIDALVGYRQVPLFGDGLQQRDMTYVGDIVTATLAAGERGRSGRIYNIASGAPIALIDILNELAEVVGKPLRLKRLDSKAGDVRHTWGDIRRATSELGYVPSMLLREGLEEQVEHVLSRCNSVPSGLKGKRG